MKEYKVYKNIQKEPKFLGLDASNASIILVMFVVIFIWVFTIEKFLFQLIASCLTAIIFLGYAFLISKYNFSYLRKKKDTLKELNFLDESFRNNQSV